MRLIKFWEIEPRSFPGINKLLNKGSQWNAATKTNIYFTINLMRDMVMGMWLKKNIFKKCTFVHSKKKQTCRIVANLKIEASEKPRVVCFILLYILIFTLEIYSELYTYIYVCVCRKIDKTVIVGLCIYESFWCHL